VVGATSSEVFSTPFSFLAFSRLLYLVSDINCMTGVLMLTEPVSENYDEEDEDERILPVTVVTAPAAKMATTDAVHYAVAMTTSPRSGHRDPAVIEIDLLEQGYSY